MMKHTLLVSGLLYASFPVFAGVAEPDSTETAFLLADATPARQAEKGTDGPSAGSPSADPSFWSRQEFLGRWGNVRTVLDDAGIRFSGTYKGDNLGNISGGLARRYVFIHNLDLNVTVDGDRAFGLKGATFFAQVFHNNGARFSPYVGDAQVASNIEAARFTKLYQVWMQEDFLDGRLSFLAGLYDVGSEFYFTRSSGSFLNSTFGTGKELAQTGSNGPSIFPNTALALRMRACITGSIVFQAAVIDATPGSAEDPYAASFVVNSRDGALVAAEVAYTDEGSSGDGQRYTKFGVGAWTYTTDAPEVYAAGSSDESEASGGNHGVYIVAERQFSQSVAVFFRGGLAREEMNQFSLNCAAGVSLAGIIPDRADDQFGIGLAYAENGREFRDAMANAGLPMEAAELTIESTYRAAITPWLVLQPDLQYIINPGTDPGLDNAFVAGVRVEIHL